MRTVIQGARGEPLFPEERDAPPTALALGFFDGVHLGHAAVIGAAVDCARRRGWRAAVLTFSGNPKDTRLLMSPELRREAVAALGVELMAELRFERVRGLSPEEFVRELLVGQMGARAVFCGFNYRFGRGAAGDGALLKTLCARYGVRAEALPPVCAGGEPISSTRIRRALQTGRPDLAEAMMGRPFMLEATVEHGRRLGSELGFPTVNQCPFCGMAEPREGVYASEIRLPSGGFRPAVTNVGRDPTVGGKKVLWETFIPGFGGDLYGRVVRVALHRFLRPEVRFESLAALREQMRRDVRLSMGNGPGGPERDGRNG